MYKYFLNEKQLSAANSVPSGYIYGPNYEDDENKEELQEQIDNLHFKGFFVVAKEAIRLNFNFDEILGYFKNYGMDEYVDEINSLRVESSNNGSSDFEIPKNSFNRGWDDITGKDTITYNCPLCTGPKGSIQSYTYTGGSMSWDNCYANLVQYCLGDRTGQTSNKVMNVTCNGNQCENWWPPRESGYTPMGMTYDAKLSCVIMDGNTIEHLTTLCIYGEPTFTYNNYNIKDRYEIEKKKLGLQAIEISKRSKRKIDNLWQKQLDKL